MSKVIEGITFSKTGDVIFPDNFDPGFIDSNGNTPLMQLLFQSDELKIVCALINQFGEKCLPEYVDKFGQTALMYSTNWNEILPLLVDKFGEKCLPGQLGLYANTALIYACCEKNQSLALKLLNSFGKICLPEHVNENEDSAITLSIKNKDYVVLQKIFEVLEIKTNFSSTNLQLQILTNDVAAQKIELQKKEERRNALSENLQRQIDEALFLQKTKSQILEISSDPQIQEMVRPVFDILMPSSI